MGEVSGQLLSKHQQYGNELIGVQFKLQDLLDLEVKVDESHILIREIEQGWSVYICCHRVKCRTDDESWTW